MALSREQLNVQARLLAERAQLLSVGLTSSHQLVTRDEEGESELRADCGRLEEKIRKTNEECRLLPELPQLEDKDSALALLLEQRKLQAEISVWQKQTAEVLTTRSSLIEAATRHQVGETVAQLVETLSVARGDRNAASKRLERERGLLEQSKEIEKALKEKISALEKENESATDSIHSRGDRRNEQLLELQQEAANLKETLQEFTTEHILQPSEWKEKGGKKTKHGRKGQKTLDSIVITTQKQNSDKDLLDLAQVVLRLVGLSLESPHDPYLSVDGVWPPHLQLLVRAGAVQRHPDNPSLIRITSYHR